MVLPKKGDIIKFKRGVYDHYGIYVGGGKIIHRAGPPGGLSTAPASVSSLSGAKSDKAEILEEDLEKVAGDTKEAYIANFLDDEHRPFSPEEIVKRARSKLGQKGYNVFFENCEHFVTWCRNGKSVSEQANKAKAVLNFLLFGIMDLVEAVRNATNPDFQ